MKLLRAGDILEREPDAGSPYCGKPVVKVWNGKGGKQPTGTVLSGHEQAVLSVKAPLAADAIVFPRIPRHLDVHAYRREYAQALYLSYAPGRRLPPPEGRLKHIDYDGNAAKQVTLALGHNRIEVVLQHYLR